MSSIETRRQTVYRTVGLNAVKIRAESFVDASNAATQIICGGCRLNVTQTPWIASGILYKVSLGLVRIKAWQAEECLSLPLESLVDETSSSALGKKSRW